MHVEELLLLSVICIFKTAICSPQKKNAICLFAVPTSFGGLQLYKAALGNCFEIDEWGPIEFSIMAKHFDRQGKPPYAYHAVRTLHACLSFTASYTCLPLRSSYFVRRKHPISCLFSIYILAAWYASLMYAFSVFLFQQYLAHLLSHGQLDGSG